MDLELLMRAQSEVEPFLEGPREGEETETSEKGGGAGETKRAHAAVVAADPREGDETETSQRDGGSQRQTVISSEDPRDGDDTVPIRESPLSPPVRV